jgi:DNA-binding response OmpR family regulator
MSKIFIIEDDLKLRKYLQEYLSGYDYEAILVQDFDDVIGEFERVAPDLILLDINLPTFDGYYFLKLIRKKCSIPIIIVSARSEEGEQIRGMELGADDYITKPFSVGILLAKISAILRRTSACTTEKINISGLILDEDSMRLRYNDENIDLSKNEYKILKLLMTNFNRVIAREELLEALWDDSNFVDDNTLTVNITRVKKKISELGATNTITTKRGVGYVFN